MALYDEVPYPVMTYSYTHPDRLAVVGRLMGLDVASPARCRVLDLGCGSGANLIAMASACPRANSSASISRAAKSSRERRW